jgi:sigma-B regulation protein RsbU (phosphoserine phosphatase)
MLASMSHHPPLGVFPTWWCNVESLPLRQGDILLFYTDGVTEARANDELFGEGRLIEWLAQSVDVPLEQLPAALLTAVLAFSGGVLKDDVAIMAVEIEA